MNTKAFQLKRLKTLLWIVVGFVMGLLFVNPRLSISVIFQWCGFLSLCAVFDEIPKIIELFRTGDDLNANRREDDRKYEMYLQYGAIGFLVLAMRQDVRQCLGLLAFAADNIFLWVALLLVFILTLSVSAEEVRFLFSDHTLARWIRGICFGTSAGQSTLSAR